MKQEREDIRLFKEGFRPDALAMPETYMPARDCVFYLLHNSLPYATGGYAVRTHGLLRALVANGWHLHGVTRLGFPFDEHSSRGLNVPEVVAGDDIPAVDIIDKVYYCRTLDGQLNRMTLGTHMYLQKYIENVLRLCVEYRPELIHAASNFMNGLVATNTARMLGLPSIYEVRGLWELTHISRDPDWRKQRAYKLHVRMETDACCQATAVIAITRGLKDLLKSRGVSGDKIVVVPNGVDTARLMPRHRDRELEARLGFGGRSVIGYVGAFAAYEGLEYLLEAASVLRHKGRDDFRLMLVGDGILYERLQAMCDELGLQDVVTLTGRIPNTRVEDYYSLVDIAPFPRKGVPVCETVSPLKPFEAMSMGKAVVASNVAALADIVCDGETGLLHKKDDAKHLAHVLETLLDDAELRQRLGEAARKWVVANRDWRILSKIVGDLYRELLGRRDA